MKVWRLAALLCVSWFLFGGAASAQQKEQIPHNQDRPPNPAKSPEEAAKAMTVPPGFSVEVVAAEPNLVNPVAMTFDEKGRVWVTESLEYPRRAPGKGRDRVKVLEDTDGDGKMDKFTIFAEGLNIPSGIAVGSGGVWVANAPDILFLQDTDGDGKADKTEVVVTGFGRDDTHELPNSLTWGPDGWLYGLNGVFNRSVVNYRGKKYDFTAALFRIHPKTREFELFAEGTSNPWGVAWNQEGSAFLSACVIDHLWHLVETGYYHRQGGPYPPFTWKIESIVDYKHQKAAYCGIHFFDSDAYPAEYREKLYMGNIHGGCINVDGLNRNGSTYQGIKYPDFLTANDSWFMPVVQKTGPDGSMYILDWYDRYHCYQDANRDPAGIDRLKGRLYRVRYKDTPRAQSFDLSKETDDQLIARLASPNVFYRDLAQRLLRERNKPETIAKLQSLVFDTNASRKTRLHALWTIVGAGDLEPVFHLGLLANNDPTVRAWGVRAAGNMRKVTPEVRTKLLELVSDPSRDVVLQVATVANKVEGIEQVPLLLSALNNAGDDILIPRIVWRNLLADFNDPRNVAQFVMGLGNGEPAATPNQTLLIPRVVERVVRGGTRDDETAVLLVQYLARGGKNPVVVDALRRSLATIREAIGSGEIKPKESGELGDRIRGVLKEVAARDSDAGLRFEAVLLAGAWNDAESLLLVREFFIKPALPDAQRILALNLLANTGQNILEPAEAVLLDKKANSADFRGQVIASLGKLTQPEIASFVLAQFAALEPELKPRAIELLTQRPVWSKTLLKAIESKSISKDTVNLTQVRKLLASRDAELAKSAKAIWGSVREGRNPQREGVIATMKNSLGTAQGNPAAGAVVFKNVCGQCHKIYGEGQDVGPDITSNGRGSFDQMLSNVFDPSLVIGEAFQATSVATKDGRVLTGLQAENSPTRIVLKLQGGKLEIIPRENVDEIKVSPLSLMPEDLEKQLKPQELIDLFSFLALDKPPTDSAAAPIPGAPKGLIKR